MPQITASKFQKLANLYKFICLPNIMVLLTLLTFNITYLYENRDFFSLIKMISTFFNIIYDIIFLRESYRRFLFPFALFMIFLGTISPCELSLP